MKPRNIVEVTDFNRTEWEELISETVKFKKNIHRQPHSLKSKRVGLIFDSNSLRTRISFESAAYLLGGDSYFMDIHSLVSERDGGKRESIEDIVDTLDRMVDCYVVRDYSRKLLEIISCKAYPPFINGLCEIGHPSQALADLSVLKWKKGNLDGLRYAGVCSDKGSGVMESFIYGVLLLGQQITIITPTGKLAGKNLDFHDQIKELEKTYKGKLLITKEMGRAMALADVLYVDEWWENKPGFLEKRIGKYRVDDKFLKNSKKNLSILHCLPAHAGREISAEIMRSPRSIIFDEAEFRVYSAMALLDFLIGRKV